MSKGLFQLIGAGIALIFVASCAGGSGSGKGSTGSQTTGSGDWTFVLAKSGSVQPLAATSLGTLKDLGTLTPGQALPAVNILAVGENGFTGAVTLSDVASNSADHIAAVPNVQSVNPTPTGAPFSVGITIPPTYSFGGSGVTFQGKDSQGRTKTANITFKVSTVSGSFAPVSFNQTAATGSGSLVLTPLNGLTGPISIAFDKTIKSTDGARSGDLALPSTVTVAAPSSPVTLGSTQVTTAINFTWTAWNPGNYAVIAVLSKAGTGIGIRVPLEITITPTTTSSSPYIVTWQYGNSRQGANSGEGTLTQSNVNSATFGKLFTQALDAKTEGQPLYLPSVMVKGAKHNVVFVATTNNSVYAFDADNNTSGNASPLWKVNFGAPPAIGSEDAGNENLDGILSTPVIQFNPGSTNTGTIYVVAKTAGSPPVYKIHGLDITTGAETAGGPATISGSVAGPIGPITLKSKNAYQRPALALVGNNVYVAIGGQYGDPSPDRGWVFGFNASNLSQSPLVFNTCRALDDSTKNEIGGSIWMSGAGIASDGTNLFVSTGNGDFSSGVGDYGDSILKLSPTLSVLSFFSPSNTVSLANSDLDLGSAGPVLIPSQGGSPPLVIQLSKTNVVYIANTNSLGGFNSASDNIYQESAIGANLEYLCNPAYANGTVYMMRGGKLNSFKFGAGKMSTTASATAATSYFGYQPTPVICYKGSASPIVWTIENGASAILHAYAASDLHELYNSNTARDAAGGFAKFAPPAVVNGKVYVPCSNELAVYGLLTPSKLKAIVTSRRH